MGKNRDPTDVGRVTETPSPHGGGSHGIRGGGSEISAHGGGNFGPLTPRNNLRLKWATAFDCGNYLLSKELFRKLTATTKIIPSVQSCPAPSHPSRPVLSSPVCPVLPVLSVPSLPSCPSHPVRPVQFCLFRLVCPVRSVLFRPAWMHRAFTKVRPDCS